MMPVTKEANEMEKVWICEHRYSFFYFYFITAQHWATHEAFPTITTKSAELIPKC